MKKLMTMMLGLSLALGSVAMFAADTKAPKSTKAKSTKTKAPAKAKKTVAPKS